MMQAEISEPRASIMQMPLMISILETRPTPSVAQNRTSALEMIEASDASAAAIAASFAVFPLCSSSRKRVVIRMA